MERLHAVGVVLASPPASGLGFRFRVLGFGVYRVLGFGVWGLGFRVQGSGFRVQGPASGQLPGFGLRV